MAKYLENQRPEYDRIGDQWMTQSYGPGNHQIFDMYGARRNYKQIIGYRIESSQEIRDVQILAYGIPLTQKAVCRRKLDLLFTDEAYYKIHSYDKDKRTIQLRELDISFRSIHRGILRVTALYITSKL